MAIDYVAYNRAGARVAGVVEVDSVEEAEERLWSSGLLVVELKEQVEREERSLLARLFPTLFGATIRDVITTTRQLETLLRAGVSLPAALRQLRDQTRNPGFRDVLRDIIRGIEGGERFSRACARYPKVFPPYYLRLLPMAEEMGDLPAILSGILSTMERQQSVSSRAGKAVVTPVISLVVASLAGIVLFTFVLPKLVELLGEFGGELPLITRSLIATADLGKAYGIYMLVVMVVVLVASNLYFTQTRRGIHMKDRLLLKLPIISPVVRSSTMFDICSTMALLLRAGVAPVVALRAVVTMTGNRVMQDALRRVEAEVTRGVRLGQAFLHQPDFPALFSDTMVSGEQTGSLRQNLEALADYYQEETERTVSRGTTLLEPALILIVGGGVGFVAIAIIAGIYSVIPQISSTI